MRTTTPTATTSRSRATSLVKRALRNMGILLTAIGLLMVGQTVALAGGDPAHPGTELQQGPSLASQLASMTPSQVSAYHSKIAAHAKFVARRGACPIGPARNTPACSYGPRTSVWMNQQQEGGNDTWCGPATVSMIYSHWSLTVTQSQAASDMGTNGDGTSRGALLNELNHYQSYNPYVMQQVGPGGGGTVNQSGPTDLYNYAADDIANYSAPVAYNIETDSYYHRHPLWHYQTVDWKHYFAGYAYDYSNNLGVQDPHYGGAQDWYYYTNLWMAIDNMTTGWDGYGGFLPNILYW